MTKLRILFIASVYMVSAAALPAHAEEGASELPPAPLSPWRVSNHTIGDSYAHATDIAWSPIYRVGHATGMAWHRLLGRDKQRVKVRLTMDPTEPAAETPAE